MRVRERVCTLGSPDGRTIRIIEHSRHLHTTERVSVNLVFLVRFLVKVESYIRPRTYRSGVYFKFLYALR